MVKRSSRTFACGMALIEISSEAVRSAAALRSALSSRPAPTSPFPPFLMVATVMNSASAAGVIAVESSSHAHRDLSNFTGAPWAGTVAETDTCAGKATSHTIHFSGTFTSNESNGLQTMGATGCEFDFDVAVYTGTLSNGPVSCGTSQAGAAAPLTVTAYTITSTDGVTLTGSISGTRARDGNDCTFAPTISATR
jgi:hypothetical protein